MNTQSFTDADLDQCRANIEDVIDMIMNEVPTHPTASQCQIGDCEVCSYRDCPYHCIEHYHHDGCPSCF